jgi:hypothetical protein
MNNSAGTIVALTVVIVMTHHIKHAWDFPMTDLHHEDWLLWQRQFP